MTLDTAPNFNPNTPIPNSPFYWPETNTIQGGNGVLVVGAGLTVNALDRLAREVAGYGADALVLEPMSLREDVVARLTAQAQDR